MSTLQNLKSISSDQLKSVSANADVDSIKAFGVGLKIANSFLLSLKK